MEKRQKIIKLLNDTLRPERFKDYCPNGLQVEGAEDVQRIVTGVTASEALIDAAIQRNAHMVLVHHGYFWKGEAAAMTGIKRNRIKKLLEHDISLVAYHLPLDVHPVYGNNVQLAKRIGLIAEGGLEPDNPLSVGLVGRLEKPMTVVDWLASIEQALQRQPLHIPGVQPLQQAERDAQERVVERVAWCTGAAQGYIEQAIELGVDAYLTGEVSEPTVHIAREAGIEFISAGHHATERYGVEALGEYIASEMALEVEFVDIPNPV